jgi:hypothetical protein
MSDDARDQFFALLKLSVAKGSLVKLTLGKSRSPDPSLKNLFVRPVVLKKGPHLTFLWRHATRDITKNLSPDEGLALLQSLIGSDFLDAHLFTQTENAQLECQPDGSVRLRVKTNAQQTRDPVSDSTVASHDRTKSRPVPPQSVWLRELGVTNDRGQPREGMTDKFRQIQKFAELLSHLLTEAELFRDTRVLGAVEGNTGPFLQPSHTSSAEPLRVVDMGSGKGYLTFAVASLLGTAAHVQGIEARPELAEFCNRIAQEQQLASNLRFTAGTIADTSLASVDVLIALHACDTATDDAIAKGVAAGAKLIVVSPCCQKEIRPQLTPPPVLSGALQHGIFQERQAEFVTDALRAQLLEWAGYRTRVFEFISTEHTAKNIMIAAIKTRPPGDLNDATAIGIRAFASFYGIRHQQLAKHLHFDL